MDRHRSTDSLDNCDDDGLCPSSASSSPLEFTSDDETNTTNTAFLMSGYNRSRLNRQNVLQNQNRNTMESDIMSSQRASTSYWNRDLVSRQVTTPVTRHEVYKGAQKMDRPVGYENSVDHPLVKLMSSYIDDSEEDTRPPPEPTLTLSITGPRPNSSSTVTRFCARLVECRSLSEVIQFIDLNRDIIDSLTRIVREAPAFRNYDLDNYQIDYSVKESFNPSFWLDREPVVTTADGNCQYHAVSLSLTGTEDYTNEVRLATAVAVVDNIEYFDPMLKLIDRGTVLDLVHTIARSYCWGDETTLKAIAVAINRRIFLYSCNTGKKDYEMLKLLSKEELLDAFKEKKYRGGTGIHTYADPLDPLVPASDYIMLFHKSEHFIAVLPKNQQITMFEPYNPIVPNFI